MNKQKKRKANKPLEGVKIIPKLEFDDDTPLRKDPLLKDVVKNLETVACTLKNNLSRLNYPDPLVYILRKGGIAVQQVANAIKRKVHEDTKERRNKKVFEGGFD